MSKTQYLLTIIIAVLAGLEIAQGDYLVSFILMVAVMFDLRYMELK